MLIIYSKVIIMMDIIVKEINICLVGTAMEEIVHIAFKTNHMIDKGQIQGNRGIHQITSINCITLMTMIVKVVEIRIIIGLKQTTVRIDMAKS